MLFQPGRDDEFAFRFGHDAGVAAMLCLAMALWPLGELERAVLLVNNALERTEALPDARTRAYARVHAAMFELMRGRFSQAVSHASGFARVVQDYDLAFWRPLAEFFDGWVQSECGRLAEAASCVVPGSPKCGIQSWLSRASGLRRDSLWQGGDHSPNSRRSFPTRRAVRLSCSTVAGQAASCVLPAAAIAPPR